MSFSSKKLLTIISALLIIGAGIILISWFVGSVPNTDTNVATPKGIGDQNVLFTVNAGEFIYAELSAETLDRIIDIHEKYNVLVDIYLDDALVQSFIERAPAILERLKTSKVVAVSYHIRPPFPYYSGFDWDNITELSKEDLRALFIRYETQATDPATGKTTEAKGGYDGLKQLMGYAPPVFTTPTDQDLKKSLTDVYRSLGGQMVVEHKEEQGGEDGAGGGIPWGTTKNGVLVRPEDVAVRLFERTDEKAAAIIPQGFAGVSDDGRPLFMNIKVHDNDFIADKAAWVSIYQKNKQQHRNTATPPFDLSLGTSDRHLLTEVESKPIWTAYEDCVKYVSEHTEYTSINAFTLVSGI